MYVVTFYSYKGGVGRTMALVNVGAELARSGRSVLLVDFDLEAPGIETFNLPKPRSQKPGVVDYITRYLSTGKPPQIEDYVYQSTRFGDAGGSLWIMPPGKQDKYYGHRLHSINWQHLYGERDGYLMFENLKAQWKQHLEPDYVLIDSRTGHTDVGGICTRHLPDAVTILFLPNEQNLSGLKKVVEDIRQVKHVRGPKPIELHFVTCNVPDIDDEEGILERRMKEFKETLGYKRLSATINRYNDLALIIDQVVFTLDRPHTRLAREYGGLVKAIIRRNSADREGALHFLADIKRVIRQPQEIGLSQKEVDDRLVDITTSHSNDGEILYQVGIIRDRQGQSELALDLLSEAVKRGQYNSEILLRRARLYSDREQGEEGKAIEDIKKVLMSGDINYIDATFAIKLIRRLDSGMLNLLPESRAIAAMDFDDTLIMIHQELQWDQDSLRAAEPILRRVVQNRRDPEEKQSAERELSLCLIGLGRYQEAMSLISVSRLDGMKDNIVSLFNYAMAEWASLKEVPGDLFSRVLELHDQKPGQKNANYCQCMAIASWALGRPEEAQEWLEKARNKLMEASHPVFSAWRYRKVAPMDFMEDLNSLQGAIARNEIICPLTAHSDTTVVRSDK